MKSDLETEIRSIPSVINAVIFSNREGRPVEVQAFTMAGSSEREVRGRIADVLAEHGHIQDAEKIVVFELSGEPTRVRPGEPSVKGARPSWTESESAPVISTAREARTQRPQIGKISLAGSGPNAEASVKLVFDGKEAEGLGRARKTTYSLRVTAAATLEAAQALVGQPGLLGLEGVSLVEAMNRRIVLVIAHSALSGGRTVLGASLVGDGPVHAATVRAALDAINRQLELAMQTL